MSIIGMSRVVSCAHDGPYCTKFRVICMASDSKLTETPLLNWLTVVVVSKLIGSGTICIMSTNIYMNYYPSTLTPDQDNVMWYGFLELGFSR